LFIDEKLFDSGEHLTDETSQKSPLGKWIPVITVVIAVAIIGIYYMTVYLPAQVPTSVPENSADVAATLPHTIYWENDCSYPVWVDVIGGEQWKSTYTDEIVGTCGRDKNLNPNPNTRCDQVPGFENGRVPLTDGGGFKLDAAGGKHTSTVIPHWQGNFWGRTGCTGTDDDLTCDWKTCIGRDGKGKLQCGGSGGTQMTKAEINFDENGFDTYDVSAVDGFNVPITIEPVAGTFINNGPKDNPKYYCTVSGTPFDLKDPSIFPSTLNKKLVIKTNNVPQAVLSACQYSKYSTGNENPSYCCIGDYGTPETCKPDTWPTDMRTDTFFKKYLPTAYSYAFDDHVSTYTCWSKDPATPSAYTVKFCGTKSSSAATTAAPVVTTPAPANAVPVVTTVPTMAPVLTQTAVPSGPYNPSNSGGATF
jgi:hypothetical protein